MRKPGNKKKAAKEILFSLAAFFFLFKDTF